jgi:hypothetical protein
MPVEGQQSRAEQGPVGGRDGQQVQPAADPLRVQREVRAPRELDQGLVVVQHRDQLRHPGDDLAAGQLWHGRFQARRRGVPGRRRDRPQTGMAHSGQLAGQVGDVLLPVPVPGRDRRRTRACPGGHREYRAERDGGQSRPQPVRRAVP